MTNAPAASAPPPSIASEGTRLDAVVHGSGVGVFLNPLPLGELQWNDHVKAHFHLPPDAKVDIGMFFERLHPDDRERVREAVERASSTGELFDIVYRTVSTAGEVKHIHAIGRASFDAAGVPTRFDGITLDITQQVAFQQRVRDFADHAPAMLWVTEPDGSCSFLSRGWSNFTGQAEAEGLGFGWLEMVHPDDRAAAARAFTDANRNRTRFELEHRLRRADGGWHWVIDAGQPRMGPAGEFLGYVGSVTDIHQRRNAEDALRRSEERYRTLLGSIDQGFCVVQVLFDAAGRPHDYRFVETNAVFERQTGLTGALGRTARELIPHLEPFWFETYGAVALGGEPRRFTHGSEAMGRWFDVYASRIGAPQDRQVAILFNDITRQVRNEQRLQVSEDRYRAFVANSSEGIWRMEFEPPVDTALPLPEQVDAVFRAGRFAECNLAFARMYGYDAPADLIGRGLELMFEPQDPGTRDYLGSLIRAGYRVSDVESQERDREGRTVWFANSLMGIIEQGRLVRAWGVQRDITDRKQAESALLEADRRKDEFLATLAHELRNPLAPIRSAAEVLRLLAPPDATLARHRDIIDRQVRHLTRLIDDLMDVSRITRNRLELHSARLQIDHVVMAAVENCRAEIDAGRHALRVDLPPEPLWVEGDEVRLVQIVLNLLANAAKYSPPETPIHVSVAREGSAVVVTVRDQGIGIAPDHLPRVFELFYQVDGGTSRAQGGLGIGLSLVRRLAELHGGSVEADSPGVGQGSAFRVRLPLAAAAEPLAHPLANDSTPGAGQRVLVVDDNRDSADTLTDLLRLLGFEAEAVYDGASGLARAQALKPQIVLMDLGMPGMDGFETCQRLRSQPWGAGVVLVAVSGWGQAADRQRSRAAGFDAHLVKPITPGQLLDVLRGHKPAAPKA
jgi:PAS domain S-box-containing protein